ncbi:Uncharacterised protein [Campylobacter hyointestinalis subsp. hyointestinalis]|uniref:Uncharacterized protein n=1 Tax=Campylobacter hyointestinalis subsp. hyointestinalis TaxID=91352 RepID=A0A9W5EVW1_CAMHY|nr:hypothetical protein [Campylobacter hyointestinalis]CUU77303.1 Uncharacterised protein [Campylobacter hyointestinalis subsp. hyointestinalis]CUU92469.1 Uncharacterised protein [Campylobacter hyointestinalis subsp. hyointestinalis]
MGYEMERPSVKELSEKFKAEERKDRAKITRPQLRPCDPKYQPTMDKYCKKLHDYFYPKAEPSQKYFKRKDTQVRIRLNIFKRYCKELTALADELENEIKVGEPYHIKETATKIINYIKGY